MPVYRKSKNKYRIVLWRKGKRHDWIVDGTIKEAKAFEATKLIELQAGEPLDKRTAPLFSIFSTGAYADHARVHLRETTRSVRKYQLATLVEHFGQLKLTEVVEEHIEGFKRLRVERDRVEAATVNGELNALSAVLTYARSLRVPCSNPKIVRIPTRRKKGRVKFFSTKEIRYILLATNIIAPKLFPLVKFLFETGARKSEATNLPWVNVLFDQGMVRIWSASADDDEGEQDGNDYAVKSVEREVPFSDDLLQVLREQKARGFSTAWVFPAWKTNNAGKKGERYAHFPKGTWRRILTKATELARQDDPNAPAIKGGPHKCRHTFASHFLARKPDLFLLGRILGHSHSRVTELYSHLLPDHPAEARNVVSFPMLVAVDTAASPEVESPQNRAQDRAQRIAIAAKAHETSRKLVGAIGIEPTTPTVSSHARRVTEGCWRF
jgi:integrase